MTQLAQDAHTTLSSTEKLDLEFVIFSMDRALQLHALLSSMQHHIHGNYSVQVLYKATSADHQNAYDELQETMKATEHLCWHQESDFREDVIRLLKIGNSNQVAFLVDDIVFIRPVYLDRLNWSQYANGVMSLRLGKELDYCYTKGRPMNGPQLSPVHDEAQSLSFSWSEGEYDWAYPLSVDGHIFSRREISLAAENLNYVAPNSFEQALQLLNPLYETRPGYCFSDPVLLNIPLNRVQSENDNTSANVSPEFLLQQWNDGLMIDFKKLAGVSTQSVHQELDVSFCKR